MAVTEHGSFALAARQLHISQPSISTAITKLEEALDIQLFVRHHAQGVSLTSAGGRLLVEVSSLLDQAGEIERHAIGLSKHVKGRIHLACFSPISSVYMPKLMTGFREYYPDVELVLYEEGTSKLIEGIEANRYDVGIAYRLGVPDSLSCHTLSARRPYVIVGKEHPLATKTEVSLVELAKHEMVLLDMPRSREYFVELFANNAIAPPVSMRSPSFETVRGMVANGAGFSILVTRPAVSAALDGGELVTLEISDEISVSEIVFIQQTRHRQTKLLRVFNEYCVQFFQNA